MSFLESIFNVKDKVVVITGGTGVLGTSMATGLLKAGSTVVLLGRSKDKLNEKLKLLSNLDGIVDGYACDVLNENEIREVNRKVVNKFKRIDALINAAGGNMPGATVTPDQTIFDLKLSEFDKVTQLNFDGTVLTTMIFGKTMAEQKKGSIINISSMAVERAISRGVGYSAAKAAVENFTRWMAMELALKFGDGLRVNAIAPGFLITDQNRNLLTNEDGSLTERGETILKLTPFKRFGEPDEFIGPIIWLVSDASKFVTGTIIAIDGGFNAYSGV